MVRNANPILIIVFDIKKSSYNSFMSLWVEKFRPKKFEDMVDQEKPIALLKSFINTGSMPHMIFKGPAGTGKTSAAHILVHQLFPESIIHSRVLELNASEERGIRTVRGKIKQFVSGSVSNIAGIIPLSIVILDEADALTLDSQYALRRVMEDSSKNSRFILICNYINKIIPPLLSRCSIIHFTNLSVESVEKIVDKVCVAENISEEYKEIVLKRHRQDARKAINELQRIVMCSSDSIDSSVDWSVILDNSPKQFFSIIEDLLLDGYDVDKLIENFINWAITKDEIFKTSFLTTSMNVCSNVANHGTPLIQLTYLLLHYKSLLGDVPV